MHLETSSPLMPVIVATAALFASTLGAVAGFGAATVMLPVLVWAFGVRDAVPLLTVTMLISNASRAWFNRREVVMPVVGWFSLGSVPLAVLGAYVLLVAPADLLRRVLGAFLLLTVVYRHTPLGQRAIIGLRGFLGVGAAAGFLSALIGSVGPLMAPFFLTFGLVKGAYIGTEALATAIMHVTKLVAYSGYALLDQTTLTFGLAIGPIMIFGSYLGKRLLDRLPDRSFPVIIESVLVLAGLQFLLIG